MVDLTVEVCVFTATQTEASLWLGLGVNSQRLKPMLRLFFHTAKGKRGSGSPFFLDVWVSFCDLPVLAVVRWPSWQLSPSTLHQQPVAKLERNRRLFTSQKRTLESWLMGH